MKIIVYHSYYGCDTGCCGHIAEITEPVGEEQYPFGTFNFFHPGLHGLEGEAREKKAREYAENMIREHFGEEHVKDLDWANCVIEDD